ncbi:hypothetical protein [Vagococcus xieshaowenii]|uniref:Uncharacterized protein n=1 Tax=Vagococcus xieshaowenii TaxID=2562451 RepID=A0AAJ5EE24_9ENTE|nr:hypothetical protein [Vagococcus xieshaowenii]QCA28149.1 hypothetical protein E4Z98_02040 [Vagococcus xieshaowenii]TFZ39725.1 hypothetical protein E4031_08530 [Vagococcus xieshaowenii]
MKKFGFTKNVEKLVDPINVGSIHFLQQFLTMLPTTYQNKIIEKNADKTPHMGFVVEPYSSFLCYVVEDVEKANSLLPDNFEMVKSNVITDEEPEYYALFGSFNVHTSAFWGQRMEFYLVARDKTTGLLTWIIVDYDTNTISYDKKGGLISPTTERSIITTDFDGNVIVDIKRANAHNELVYDCNITKGVMTKMADELWLYGNLSIGYGKELSHNSPDVFSLKFDPKEVEQALKIPKNNYTIDVNNWYSDMLNTEPKHVLVFPYAQHMLSDSPGTSSLLKDVETMLAAKDAINFEKMNVYNPKETTNLMKKSSLALFFIIIGLIIALILK